MRMETFDRSGNAPYPVLMGDPKGAPNRTGVDESVVVYSNATATGNSRSYEMYGGSYVWNVVASAFNAATVTLKVLGADGVWQTLGTGKTASDTTGGTAFSLGFDSTIRIEITGGTPANLYVTVQKVS